MNRRLIEVDYDPEEGLTLRLNPFRMIPESARGHLLAANRELLLALRSTLDETIERLEKREGEASRRPRKVEVKSESASTEG